MKKSELTRQMILEKASVAFNLYGFGNTTMSKLMEVTGLEKGGIYGHFESKEELATEAFDHVYIKAIERRFSLIENESNSARKIELYIQSFNSFNTGVPGGCPVFNTAVESMNVSPALRRKAKNAYSKIIEKLSGIISSATKEGSYKKVDPHFVATFIFNSLEGAIVASNLSGDKSIMMDTSKELINYINWKCKKISS